LDRTEEEASVVVSYREANGMGHSIRTLYLVGADGKRGIVRKKFLEPEGIKQEVGLYHHVSTWVAANFEITLPTPATHPDFPLWKLGYSSEQVYDAFWPSGFQ
jgi:2-polyprenyl-6-methoxyphenol hydroxylase-like FAD-dependent oxidoreductase